MAAVVAAALVTLTVGAYTVRQAFYDEPSVADLRPRPDGETVLAAPVARAVPPGADAAVDPRWVRRTARASGLSYFAVDAYARAERAAPASCGVGWVTLAGVGWVESQHGTLGGRRLGADGRPSTPILGPALDGEGGFAAIRSTADSSRFHGDPVWDHAVGPMQFLPSTWEAWRVDADHDGLSDPDDLDDAALAAARYLCAGGRDLTTGAGWTDAVLSYNRSAAYVAAVHEAATGYAGRLS